MATNLNPYIQFTDNAREAMEFYQSVFGGQLSLSGDDASELHGFWDRLSHGGQVHVPLEKQMWGDEFGMCADRFGIGWMVNIAGEQSTT